ncbi:hypothetical protein [Vibrio sp. WXL103]|uniref:hypothetical protein n=1 Tax=Vibrio sp. WXL103 TaxID=3450710 RepID=UPI003EC6F53D
MRKFLRVHLARFALIPSIVIGIMAPWCQALASSQPSNELDGLINLSGELYNETIYPQTEVEYVLTVESRADVHFNRVNPPKAQGIEVRRAGQDHQHYFVGNDEFRVSTYRFLLSATEVGTLTIEGASLTHVESDEQGQRRRVRNHAPSVTLNSLSIPDGYQGLWLPTSNLTLDQHWSLEASLLPIGESITRTIRLFIAERDIDSFPKLTVDYPDSVSVYKQQPDFKPKDGGMVMTLTHVIVPREEGVLVLDGITIPWFDTGDYQTKLNSVEPLELRATAGSKVADVTEQALPFARSALVWQAISGVLLFAWLLTYKRLIAIRKNLTVTATDPQAPSPIEGLQLALASNQPHAVMMAWQKLPSWAKRACQAEFNEYTAARYRYEGQGGDVQRQALAQKLKGIKAPEASREVLAPLAP